MTPTQQVTLVIGTVTAAVYAALLFLDWALSLDEKRVDEPVPRSGRGS